ncbi:tripartite tricarboxylate transporter TctB family protein [Vreelandella titanicae]|jgi:putative tricarboxylic transport membrane protein|uniref:tripartite tricarboxylate transporter TctB family protein n=1 Tax=Vreelandella TaxID=3137766 RepID=UPI000346D831|nr:tripartite tricarboxylate transporter TctB family protein [Halomonas titanicae]MCE7517840.1 tripartite tricarboxylate transporter TctB family protein [Halomonas titanicae]NVE89185.1 tripartite tricarboxylate transporter TctB family protein [Halomonas titanicae]UEQ04174.1 tripartite tricarboxylate transporter TctB family protein [Halomonas profundus]SDI56885.1 putative tricarboxylic transport membrane protein [Halomonas titanicae]|tara:strand:+ start:783 stop:1289 length:507 start_codon:yes stop_codon:yes gene_type:complete
MTPSGSKRRVKIKDTSDLISGIVLLGFAIVLVFYLVPNYINEPPILQNPMMSPRWLPTIIGWLILLFSVLLILQAFIVEQRAEEDERAIEKGSTRRFVLMVLSLVIYVALFEAMGAVFCGILATLVLFVAHPVRTWWVYSLAFLFPIIVTLLFVEVMNVPLPIMPLGF